MLNQNMKLKQTVSKACVHDFGHSRLHPPNQHDSLLAKNTYVE